MLRLITQHRISTIATLPAAAVALLMVNCSATGDPVSSSNGGTQSSTGGASSSSGGSAGSGTVNTYGGYLGSGGSNNASGGSNNGSGGAAKGGSTGSGGSSTGSGGSTTTGSGGATSTGNGGAATTGSGGAAATSCATYKGTLAKDSTIFKDGFGTAKSGTTPWSGYAYTYSYGTGVTLDPVPMTGCFKGAQVCASGSVPASYDAGAGVGWNIAQVSGSSSKTTVALTGSVKVTAAGVAAGMRLNLAPPQPAEVFCYTLTATDVSSLATGLTLPVTSFKQYCYDATKAVAYAGEKIEAIQIAVPGDKDAGAKPFDFCMLDIEPG